MKKIFTLSLFVCLSSMLPAFTPIVLAAPVAATDKPVPGETILQKISSLKIKVLQKLAGRKFTLKEKIGLFILRKRLKHASPADSGKGETALIFGIGAMVLLGLAIFVPIVWFFLPGSLISSILAIIIGSSAAKKDPSDQKARTGKLLGWIGICLIAAIALLAAIVLSTGSWTFGG